jgi:hypothetical protein
MYKPIIYFNVHNKAKAQRPFIAVFGNLFSPAARPNLCKTHDAKPQILAQRKGETKLYTAVRTYLHKNPCL